MATGSLKTMNDAIIVETVRIANSASASTYYYDFTAQVNKNGYTAVGLVGHRFSGAGYHAYWAYIDIATSTIHIGAAKESGSVSNLDVYAYVLWVRNDLL